MNENAEVHGAENDNHVPPERPVMPKADRPGASSEGCLHYIVYSDLAWFALVVAQLISGVGCLAVVLFGIYELFRGLLLADIVLIISSAVGTPVAFVLQLAVFVAFARVAELERCEPQRRRS